MNDFTKEELKELMYGLWCRAKIDGLIVNKTLYDKLKSMIDNYKDGNEMTDTFRKEYNSLHKLHGFEKQVKEKAEELEMLFKEISAGREISLAITNLEQSIMWAVKALYKPSVIE